MKNYYNYFLAITLVSLFFTSNNALRGGPAQTTNHDIKIIEGIVSQMNERLNHLGDEIIQLRGEIIQLRDDMKSMENSLRSEMKSIRVDMKSMENSLRSDMNTNFRWALTIIFGSWITIIGTFVAFFLALFNKLNDPRLKKSD